MKVLIAYDVCTIDKKGARRLRKVAQACSDYGVRVQKSLFECDVGSMEWIELRSRLLDEMDMSQDSIRFYFLPADLSLEHHGINEPFDLNGPLVL